MNCQMHHLFHDLTRSVASSDCLAVEACKKLNFPATTRHVSMTCKERICASNIIAECWEGSLLVLFVGEGGGKGFQIIS